MAQGILNGVYTLMCCPRVFFCHACAPMML